MFLSGRLLNAREKAFNTVFFEADILICAALRSQGWQNVAVIFIYA
jgi:hypothetical protein